MSEKNRNETKAGRGHEKAGRRKPMSWWAIPAAAVLAVSLAACSFSGTEAPDGSDVAGGAGDVTQAADITAAAGDNNEQNNNEAETPEQALEAEPLAVAEPEYPVRIEYGADGWDDYKSDVDAANEIIDKSFDDFMEASIPAVIKSFEPGTNCVFSPINVYLALGMLTEICDGESRQQLLDLLGAESAENVAEIVRSVYRSFYNDGDGDKLLLGNSLWLSNRMRYNNDMLKKLAEDQYAASYFGPMGSEIYNEMLRDWIDENTGRLFSRDKLDTISLNEATVAAIVSTLYYKSSWTEMFSEEYTFKDTFHAPNEDVEADFMTESGIGSYYKGDNYTACLKYLTTGTMYMFLPDEGCSPEEIIASGEAADFLMKERDDDRWHHALLSLYLPKFDFTSDTELIKTLNELGVNDVFSSEKSDFTPIMGEDSDLPVKISKVIHSVRVKTDENGFEGAAYTMMDMVAGAVLMDLEEFEIKLDRPFVFAVCVRDCPVFVGIVNDPTQN